MRENKIKLFLVVMLSFGLTGLHAQNSINAAGGNATCDGGTINYTIGQIVYSTINATSGSLAQGIQQPYEISVVTGVEDVTGIDLIYSVYPNPTNGFLVLKVENFNNKNLRYQLYDFSGKVIESKKINSNETSILMNNLVPAIYYLKVSQTQGNSTQKEIKTFKIIKN